MIRKVVITLFVGLVLWPMVSCKTTKKITSWILPNDTYAFIEYYRVDDGKAVEGEAPPGRRIDGPTYSYNAEAGEVYSYLNNVIETDSLKVLLGRGLILRGAQGGGMHSRLIPSNKVPFTEDIVTVKKLLKNSIVIDWDGNEQELPKGGQLLRVIVTTDTLYLPERKVILEKTLTHTLTFHGYLKKEKISNY